MIHLPSFNDFLCDESCDAIRFANAVTTTYNERARASERASEGRGDYGGGEESGCQDDQSLQTNNALRPVLVENTIRMVNHGGAFTFVSRNGGRGRGGEGDRCSCANQICIVASIISNSFAPVPKRRHHTKDRERRTAEQIW